MVARYLDWDYRGNKRCGGEGPLQAYEVFAGMGMDVADFDSGGLPDLFVSAPANQAYALFRNSKGLFEYSAGVAAVTRIH